MGWTNLVEGTIFEQAVADAANAGRITLPAGVDHVELASRTQDGWDLALMQCDRTVGYAQVKFAPDDHTIVAHLHDHPDIPIVIASHEAAADASAHGISVIDSRTGPLHEHVAREIGEHLDAAHLVHEWVPEVALAFIVGTAAYRRWWRGEPAGTVTAWAKQQMVSAGAANTAATLASVASGSALIRLPVSLGTRLAIERGRVAQRSAARAGELAAEVRGLASVGLAPTSPSTLS